MRFFLVICALFILSCTAKNRAASDFDPTVTKLPTDPIDPVQPTPTPTPPDPPTKPGGVDLEALLKTSRAYLNASLAQVRNIQNEDSEVLSDFEICGFNHMGPYCLDLKVRFFEDYVIEEGLTYVSHLAINDVQFLLTVLLSDAGTPTSVDLFQVADHFSRPRSREELEARNLYLAKLEIASDREAEVKRRLDGEADSTATYHAIDTLLQSTELSDATKDYLTWYLFQNRELFENENTVYRDALLKLYVIDLGAWGDRLQGIADYFSESRVAEDKQIGATLSLWLDPLDSRHLRLSLKALQHPLAFIRLLSIQALSRRSLRTREQAQVLGRVDDSDSTVSRAAFEASKSYRFGSHHYKVFKNLMQSSQQKTREFSVFLLGSDLSRASTAILAKSLNDENDFIALRIYEQLKGRTELSSFRRTLTKHFPKSRPAIRLLVAKLLRFIVSKRSLEAAEKQYNIEMTLEYPHTTFELRQTLWETIKLLQEALDT